MAQRELSSPPARVGTPSWLGFVPVALAYAVVATHQIELPGVYMDAVNPDYMAVRILNPDATGVPYWILPGNLLLGRFPVLVALYHGTQQLWLALPVFWLLGTTVVSLRIAHALFAMAVLAAVYAVVARSGAGRWLTAATCIALALDPGFVYAFRTQSYITMAPAAWLLLSVYALQRRGSASPERRWLASFASGLFLGLAIFGYFVYAFYVPVLALAVAVWRGDGETMRGRDRLRRLGQWGGGVVLGSLFYILGYGLLAHAQSGVRGLIDYIAQTQTALAAFGSQDSLWENFAYAWLMVEAVFHNWWHHDLIFGEYASVPGAAWKTAILIGAPALVWGVAEWRRRASMLLRLLLGLQLCFFAVAALAFDSRLGGHHFMSLLPLSYAALATALVAVNAGTAGTAPLRVRSLAVLLLATLLCINVIGDHQEAARLGETRGVGLYSDAINRFADDLGRSERSDIVFTPDWGLFMPVAFLTGGRLEMVTDEDYAQARQAACHGRRVLVALIEGDRGKRFARWQDELGAGPPQIRDYRQFDGMLVFQLGIYSVAPDAPTCAAARASPPA